MIRNLWWYLNLLVSTIVVGSTVVISSFVRKRNFAVHDWATRDWGRWVMWAAGVEVVVEGEEHVRRDAPQIFVSNHASWFDVWALASYIPKRNRFVAKKELERVPVFGQAWQAAGHISVDRTDRASAIRSLREAASRLHKDNISVVIFPEGTRSRTGELGEFKKGAFMLAFNAGVDIVPTAVVGTREIMAADSWRVRPGRIIVRFGKPIRTADYGVNRRDELIEEVRREIEALLKAPPQA